MRFELYSIEGSTETYISKLKKEHYNYLTKKYKRLKPEYKNFLDKRNANHWYKTIEVCKKNFNKLPDNFFEIRQKIYIDIYTVEQIIQLQKDLGKEVFINDNNIAIYDEWIE